MIAFWTFFLLFSGVSSAVPPDVRKGCALSVNVIKNRGYASVLPWIPGNFFWQAVSTAFLLRIAPSFTAGYPCYIAMACQKLLI